MGNWNPPRLPFPASELSYKPRYAGKASLPRASALKGLALPNRIGIFPRNAPLKGPCPSLGQGLPSLVLVPPQAVPPKKPTASGS
jgi:hypothetical protein